MARHGWATVVAMVLAAVAGVVPATGDTAEDGRGVVIRRTAHGIPHVLASTYRGVVPSGTAH